LGSQELDLGRRLLVELSDNLDVHVGRDYREGIRRHNGEANVKRVRLE
jgi:hypothetical protein